jgi:hypothetical protein
VEANAFAYDPISVRCFSSAVGRCQSRSIALLPTRLPLSSLAQVASLRDLSEQQLRDRARSLKYDAEAALSPTARARATAKLNEVEDELASRYAKRHPLRTGLNRVLAKVLGADRRQVERHLRSVGRDEL